MNNEVLNMFCYKDDLPKIEMILFEAEFANEPSKVNLYIIDTNEHYYYKGELIDGRWLYITGEENDR